MIRYIDYKAHYHFYCTYCDEVKQRPVSQFGFKNDTLNYFKRWFLDKKGMLGFKASLEEQRIYVQADEFSMQKKLKRVILIVGQKKNQPHKPPGKSVERAISEIFLKVADK